MQRVRLGKTNLEVSRIAFGGIPIQRLTEAEAVGVVQHCIDVGVNLLDTANGYTTSEERIGKAIDGRRERVIIATKTGARDTLPSSSMSTGGRGTPVPDAGIPFKGASSGNGPPFTALTVSDDLNQTGTASIPTPIDFLPRRPFDPGTICHR